MDPNANLQEQAQLAKAMTDASEYPTSNAKWLELADRADRLAELVIALDEWIAKGGFLPTRWQRDSKAHPDADVVDEIGGF